MRVVAFGLLFLSWVGTCGQQNNVQPIPDCSLGVCAGFGAPTQTCQAGQKFAQTDAPGTNYTCTGSPAHWVQDSGSQASLTPSLISGALGYAPVSPAQLTTAISNIPQLTSAGINTALGYAPVSPSQLSTAIAGVPTVTSGNIATALGYTPVSPTTLSGAIAAIPPYTLPSTASFTSLTVGTIQGSGSAFSLAGSPGTLPSAGSQPVIGFDSTNNNLLTEVNTDGTKTVIGGTGGSGSGSTGTGTQYQLPQYSSTSGTLTNSNVTTDSTGNNITVPGDSTSKTTNKTVFHCEQYAGADPSVQMNACTTAAIAAGGGTLDFTAFTGKTYPVFSQQVNLGSPTSGLPNQIALKYKFPATGTWTWGFTDGTSCGLMQYGGTDVEGSMGTIANRLLLNTATGITGEAMQALYCTDPAPMGSSTYMKASNLKFQNSGGATFTDGMIAVRHIYDGSQWDGIDGINATGDAMHIYDICCHSVFTKIGLASAQTSSGGHVFVIGKAGFGTVSVEFNNITANTPGIGKNDILIQGGSQTNGLSFFNVYEEGNQSVDTTTPMNQLGSSYGVIWTGGTLNASLTGPDGTTKPIFNTSASNFTVQGISTYNSTVCVIDVPASNYTYLCQPGSGNLRFLQRYEGGGANTKSHFQYLDTTNASVPSFYGNTTYVLVPAPFFPTLTTKTTGGTLPDSTQYFYKVTSVNADGVSTGSAELNVTTGTPGGTSSNGLSWAFVSGATGYNVYRATATGAEQFLATVSGVYNTTYTDTGSVSPTATTVPTVNTTYGSVTVQNNGAFVTKSSTGTQNGSFTNGVLTAANVNATTGYQLNGSAPNGHVLCGNGTNYVDASSCGSGGGAANTSNTPLWLQYLGDGADGAYTASTSANLSGVFNYTNFTVPSTSTLSVTSASGLVIRATGTCTIAGTIVATPSNLAAGVGGGSSGGSGGGTAAGTAGANTYLTAAQTGLTSSVGGTAGAASGGTGTNGATPTLSTQRVISTSGGGSAGLYLAGAGGQAGGSSGGARGNGGGSIVLICAQITGTDGTNTGTISTAGGAGTAGPSSTAGGGSGGGGGVILLSSQATIPTLPTFNVAGGAGGASGGATSGVGGNGGNGWSMVFQGW